MQMLEYIYLFCIYMHSTVPAFIMKFIALVPVKNSEQEQEMFIKHVSRASCTN
jgi:hypothetical protein